MKKIFSLFVSALFCATMFAQDAETATWTVAGNNTALFGVAWTPSHEANDMAEIDGLFTWLKGNVTLSAGDVEFKVCKDHAWNVAYPSDNYKLSIPVDGVYDVIITFNESTKGVSAVANKKSDAEIIHTVSIKGSWDEWTDPIEFESTDDNITASTTLVNIAKDSTIQFKVLLDGDQWRSNSKEFTRAEASAKDITHNDASNMSFTADKDGDYIFTWTFETNSLAITFPELVSSAVTVNNNENVTISVLAGEEEIGEKVVENTVLTISAVANLDTHEVTSLRAYKTGDESVELDILDGKLTMPDFAITISAVVEHKTVFYIAGTENLTGGPAWIPDAIAVRANSYTFENLPADYYRMMVTIDGVWSTLEDPHPQFGYDELTDKSDAGLIPDNGRHICFRLLESADVTVTYNAEDPENIVFTVTTSGSFFSIADGYYLAGILNGESAWYLGALNATKKFELTEDQSRPGQMVLHNVTLALGDEFKVAKVERNDFAGDDYWYGSGAGGANFIVTESFVGVKDIYFVPTWQDDWNGHLYVADPISTAVDNATEAVKAVKFFENGQMFIRANGNVYDAKGVMVK